MKTTAIISKSKMILIGAILINCVMTSCMTGKNFSDKMKYTYYKKVKAQSKKETTATIVSVQTENKKTIVPQKDSAVIYSKVPTTALDYSLNNNVKKEKSNSVAPSKNETRTAKASGAKKEQLKRIFNEKVKSITAPKSNTKEANGSRGSVLGTILLVLLIILLVYVLIVLLFIGLMNAAGGICYGGC